MITIATEPQLYTPLNLALFKISSDRPTILQFKVTVFDALTSTVITVQKYATLPMINLGTCFDLANLLSPFVLTPIVNTTNVLEQTDRIYKSYKLKIQEIYLVDGTQTDGDILDTGVYNIFNATLSRLDFRIYDYRYYVAGSGVLAKFLSLRPLVSNVFYGEMEYIYFMTTVNLIARVTYYKADGTSLSVRDTYVNTDNRVYRLELSPIEIIYNNSNPFSDEFTPPFGITPGADSTAYYALTLFAMDGVTPLSETRTYVVKPYRCLTERLQTFFTNNLGGLDSMSFTNPKQSSTSIKTLLNANTYQYDANGNYIDFRDGVYNPARVTISSRQQNTFSLISDPLTDATATYAKSLIESDAVYLRLKDSAFLPITLETQDYEISRRKYSVNNNRLSISFKIEDINLNL